MSYYVYILRCSDGLLYTGITGNLRKRIGEHNDGAGGPVTKNRRPVRLAHWEEFSSRIDAAKREREIKGWRREKKEKLIAKLEVYTEEQFTPRNEVTRWP